MSTLKLHVNGELTRVTVGDPAEPLLYVLRNQVGMQAVRFGCGVAQCGACTVILNGTTTRSCITKISSVPDQSKITTLEGLARGDDLSAVQRAFIGNQAGQCAYCIPGISVAAHNWLSQRRASGNKAVPSDDEVKSFLSAPVYLCRCGSHMRIVRAIQQASQEFGHEHDRH